ncbi:MAG: hypothetical protein IPJ64_14030 [Saprospiraceae bacterium]|nr:hypothetical protein [Saprospiraceae bacterium]
MAKKYDQNNLYEYNDEQYPDCVLIAEKNEGCSTTVFELAQFEKPVSGLTKHSVFMLAGDFAFECLF